MPQKFYTNRLDDLIGDCNGLSELLAEAASKKTSDKAGDKSEETWYWKLYEKTIKAVFSAILDKAYSS